ncbi:hypothetical protein DFJ63DRAFT_287266 [Scheffersomyces coipomensis]|uniref:uncharacterized protein n=1 Tax=Scheffersomyces coipomensis TaxID=1788519 RepID=UPI00315C657F
MAVKDLVLVTGGTGYVATFTLYQLLQRGYQVKTTVRNLSKTAELEKDLINLNIYDHVKADLTKAEGWDEALENVENILHIASPIGDNNAPEDIMIKPAVEGTIRILDLALKYGAKRVVVLSSGAAVKYNKLKPDPKTGAPAVSDESAFSDKDLVPNTYAKSKLMQELATWEWVKSTKNQTSPNPVEVTVLNPVAIYGPNIPGKVSLLSLMVIKGLIDGKQNFGSPRLFISGVDVRDVAYLSYRAMIEPFAKNERYIVDSNPDIDLSLYQLSQLIRKHYSIPQNNTDDKVDLSKLPVRELPSWLIRGLSYFMPSLRPLLHYLDFKTQTSNAKAAKAFDWEPISLKDSVVASINSL